ncbi:unnamed protein product, partial [Amoebophrya sp. A120]
ARPEHHVAKPPNRPVQPEPACSGAGCPPTGPATIHRAPGPPVGRAREVTENRRAALHMMCNLEADFVLHEHRVWTVRKSSP